MGGAKHSWHFSHKDKHTVMDIQLPIDWAILHERLPENRAPKRQKSIVISVVRSASKRESIFGSSESSF